ncbi:hypothetical protein QUF81_19645 [Peribacillus simplex]|nr:hypothetical protein [Peribacillus simplex]MDM5295328.1 hypothetical protein [Peribacillus simplex]
MAEIQTITLSANTSTILVNGTGQRVWIQGNSFYLGGSDVNSNNGISIHGHDNLIDLGNITFGENIYAFSNHENTITVLYYSTAV